MIWPILGPLVMIGIAIYAMGFRISDYMLGKPEPSPERQPERPHKPLFQFADPADHKEIE